MLMPLHPHPHPNHEVLCLSNLHVEIGHQPIWFRCNCKTVRGRLVGILGPNGCGKSTLLRAIMGEVPYTGEITCLGQAFETVKSKIGYLSQHDSIPPDFPITVREFILTGGPDYFRLCWPWQRRYDYARLESLLVELDILRLAEAQLDQLSGGEKRRVHLARLLMQESDLILLDEPLAGVDEHGEQLMIAVWKRLVAEGKTIIAVHHDLESVGQIFDEILFFKHHHVHHLAVNPRTNYQELLFA